MLGCASTPERTVRIAWTDCDGTPRDVAVEVRRTVFPPAACVALANELVGPLGAILVALETHAACTALRSDGRAAIMVLPHDAPTWLAQHEFARIVDHDSRRLKPWGELPADCMTPPTIGAAD